jgi:hypothetical protein
MLRRDAAAAVAVVAVVAVAGIVALTVNGPAALEQLISHVFDNDVHEPCLV